MTTPTMLQVTPQPPRSRDTGEPLLEPQLSDERRLQLQSLNIRPLEYALILRYLGREPNFEELCMFSALWSEHCAYKHTRHLLKTLPTTGPRVICGPGENAGVIRVADGGDDERLDVVFKVESHNHPTAVEPYHGAATGVGGILRDIFTMNARPVALLNALRFGPTDHPRSNYLIRHAVKGIGHYGNCMGIPTIGGDVFFDDAYKGNPLVNAMAVGILEPEGMISAGAVGVGNPVVYAGSPTGKDGIGGASFASRSLDEEKAAEDRPAVQVGDPFAEKILMEACLEAFKTGAIVSAQDMGAAGVTCATAEMSAKGGLGMRVDLSKIPAREPNMQAFEFLLSESQERMVFVVDKDRTDEVFAIFTKWGVPCTIIGEVTESGMAEIWMGDQLVANVPATALTDDAPLYDPGLVPEEPAHLKTRRQTPPERTLPDVRPEDVADTLVAMLGRSNIIHPEAIYSNYDRHVRNGTLLASENNVSGTIRLRHPKTNAFTGKALGVTLGGNARFVALNPYMGSLNVLTEAARNLAATGCLPLGVTDNLNYGDPEAADVYYQLYQSVAGMRDACTMLETPITGGNVSLYNTTEAGSAILPSLVVGMIGIADDDTALINGAFQEPDHVVALLGRFRPALGGSEYQQYTGQPLCGEPPEVSLAAEKVLVQLITQSIAPQRLVASLQDVSMGGLLTTVAECLLSSPVRDDLGVELNLPADLMTLAENRLDRALFGETAGCYLLSTTPANLQALSHLVAGLHPELGISLMPLGQITRHGSLSVQVAGQPVASVARQAMQEAWHQNLYLPRRSLI